MKREAPDNRKQAPAESDAAKRRHGLLVCVAVSLALLAIVLIRLIQALLDGWHARRFFDDAFAFCRYADHLLAGWGLAWNAGGPQTFGCTSLLYTFWIAGLRAVTHLAPWQVLSVGSFIPGLLAVFVTGAACARVATNAALRNALVGCGFVCLCTFFQQSFFYHVSTGMDTTTALLTNAVLVLVVVDPRLAQSAPRLVLAAGVAWLTYLARPDNLLYAVFFPVLLLSLGPAARDRRQRALVVFGATLAGLLLLDAGVKTLVFGNPLPLPYYAKTRDFYAGYMGATAWNPASYTRDFLLNQSLPLLLLILAVNRRSWRLVLATLIPCGLTFAYYATITQIMGFEARFYYPALPFLLVGAYHALDARLEQFRVLRQRMSWRAAGARIATVAALAGLEFPIADRMTAWYDARFRRQNPNLYTPGLYEPPRTAPELGWMPSLQAVSTLVRTCPVQTVWAMSEHGLISALAPDVQIIDLAGLHDRNTLTGQPTAQHMLAQKPDVIWFPHLHYTGMLYALESSPTLAQEYRYWPGAFDYGLAVHRHSPARAAIERSLREVWRATYQFDLPPHARRTGKPAGGDEVERRPP